MNRRELIRFVDIKKEAGKIEKEDSFNFFTDDVTEDLKYK